MPRPRLPFFVVFLPMALLAGYMAIAYELSLVYFGFAFFVTLLTLGVLTSWLSLRRIAVERDHPHEVTVGVPFDAALTVENRATSSSCMLFTVEDTLQRDHEAHPRGTAVLALSPAERVTARFRARIDKRGAHRLEDVHLSSRFPFCMLEKRLTAKAPTTILALPRPGRLARDILGGHDVAAAEHPLPLRGGLGEFHGVRPFQPGDNPRFVHWATSARKGGMWVREYERETDRRLLVVLDTTATSDFERRVTVAATLADHYIAQGWRVALAIAHESPVWVPFGAGTDHTRRILRALAHATPASASTSATWDPRETRGAHAAVVGGDPPAGLSAVAAHVVRVPSDHPDVKDPPPHAPV